MLLYFSVLDMALGCMLTQLDDLGKERAICYLSKRMLEYECRYIMIERLCLALVWATRRLRHYVTEYSIRLVLDPLRHLFDRPVLTSRLMRWLVLLTEFDIQYVMQKLVKGSIVTNHLAALPVSPWPFLVWGVDVIGKVFLKSSNGHEYILVAIDYFTKWVEAASYASLITAKVAKFIKSHIIYRYGIPHELILDRGVHFKGEVDTLVQEYGI